MSQPSGASPRPSLPPVMGAGTAGASPSRVLALAVVSGACLMAVEIAGGKVLAPFYGSGVYVWGSIIGVFMAAMSVGYYVGGRWADARPSLGLLATIIAAAGALVLVMPWLQRPVGLFFLHDCDLGERGNPLASSLVLFGPPTALLGMVSPFAVRLLSTEGAGAGAGAGKISGRVFSLSTVGSIVGVLVTTFIAIPELPVSTILRVIGGVLLAAPVLATLGAGFFGPARGSGAAAAALLIVWGFNYDPPRTCNLDFENAIVRADPNATEADEWKEVAEFPSAYSNVFVVEKRFDGRLHRFLQFDVYRESGIDAEEAPYPRSSRAAYTDLFHVAFAFMPVPAAGSALFIGGGGGVGPRAFRRLYPRMEITVVDIDPAVKEAAERYFYYRDDEQMTWRVEDGRAFMLRRPGRKWSVIILDAYTAGGRLPGHLMTVEFLTLVKERLESGGVVVSNIISAVTGAKAQVHRAERKTFEQVFGPESVYSLPRGWEAALAQNDPQRRAAAAAGIQNLLLIATTGDPPRQTAESLARRFEEQFTRVGKLTSGYSRWWHQELSSAAPNPRNDDALVAAAGIDAPQWYRWESLGPAGERWEGYTLVPELSAARTYLSGLYEEPVDLSGSPVLTDDYCPVDAMSTDVAANWSITPARK